MYPEINIGCLAWCERQVIRHNKAVTDPRHQHRPKTTLPTDHIAPVPLDADRIDDHTGEPRLRAADLEHALAVLKRVQTLPPAHQDAHTIRVATAALYTQYKKDRRAAKRHQIASHDDAVTAATATGSPHRIDDETAGIPLRPATTNAPKEYRKPRQCYICKVEYTQAHDFYHQLCPHCAQFNWAKRSARTDLSGRRALLTGGRAKIGMYIALRLLRDGAHLTITTRFPQDAARRFMACSDSADWLDRLVIVGIDLRDPAAVMSLAESVATAGPLDVLINNAAQTVRRTPQAYAPLRQAENEPLPPGPQPELVRLDRDVAPVALATAGTELTRQALVAGAASLARHQAGTAIDAGGLIPDDTPQNSWTDKVGQISPVELLEVQLCNNIAPFILLNALRPAFAASSARRKYVVNVSAMEGVFHRGYKGPGHPHTNMAKAALNMLTRTSARELFESDQVLMTAVDTGWITDERPLAAKLRLAEAGFRAPLDLVDGAARVYDPVVRGEAGEDLFGVFLKDYVRRAW